MKDNRQWLVWASAAVLAAAIGCGGGGGEQAEEGGEAAPATEAAPAAPAAPAAVGTVAGMVKFEGTAPKPEMIKMKADKKCHEQHPDEIAAETALIGAAGELANVFVYVKDFTGKVDAPKDPVVLDQKGCTYHPHVFGIQTGQTLKIRNSDETLHNIHAMPTTNAEFNLAMPTKDMEMEQSFAKSEIMVKFKCDVHPWMAAWCGVVDHPFFAVSAADGKFTIPNLPAGKYTLVAWHETFGTQEQAIEVTANGEVQAAFTFKPAA